MKIWLILFLFAGTFLTACEKLDPTASGLLVPLTVDQDDSIPSIYINDTQLHAQAFGNPSDPMLVILHGGPGCDYRYLLNCKAFANEGFYVVFYDQRGSGLSKREDKSSYTISTMMNDLSAVIASYRTSPVQKIFLLGQSWGAMLATSFINEYPSMISGAILSEPGGFVWADIKDYGRRAQQYGMTSEALNDITYIDQFFTGGETDHTVLDYKMSIQAAVDGDKPTGEASPVPFWRYGAVVKKTLAELGDQQQPDWRQNLDQYSTRILFCYSELNRAYGEDYAKHVSSAYPNVQLERIDGVGHYMITFPEGWSRFFPLALSYLNKLK